MATSSKKKKTKSPTASTAGKKPNVQGQEPGVRANTNPRYSKMAKAQKSTRLSLDGRAKDWTRVETPATTLSDVMESVIKRSDTLKKQQEGIDVTKISSQGKLKSRVITIGPQTMAIFCTHQKINVGKYGIFAIANSLPVPLWTPSKGFARQSFRDRYVRYMDIADLTGITSGVIATEELESCHRQTPMSRDKVSQLITIWSRGNQQTINAVVSNNKTRKALVQTIKQMKDAYQLAYKWISKDALLLRYIWYDVDADKNSEISTAEFAKICGIINLHTDSRKVFAKYIKEHSSELNKSKQLPYPHVMMLLQSLKQPEVWPSRLLWKRLFGTDENKLSEKKLLTKFLHETQKETDTTEDDAATILDLMQGIELDRPNPTLLDRFDAFLHSEFNDAYDPDMQEAPNAKLNQPISRYWINTSHNTYLTGDQLQSRSSVEAYMLSLQRGCKCLELDCWDGDKDKDGKYKPIVFHGHTLTSKIEFYDILLVVKNYLDDNPKTYPIILSLENHCSHEYQKSMAAMLNSVFGKKLFVPTRKQTEDPLPSPESLRGKVVIKGKRPPEPDDEDGKILGKLSSASKLATSGRSGASGNLSGDESEPEEEDNGDEQSEADSYDEALKQLDEVGTSKPKAAKEAEKKHPKIVPELAKLTLFHGVKYKNFKKSMTQTFSHMHSIGETNIRKIVQKQRENGQLWKEYNVNHMTRTYPAGSRIDSSNYNPILAWGMGCQLVALNFQTGDANLILNDGRFRQNGGCGYILKPPSVMGKASESSPITLKIKILNGSCLPKPKGEKTGETIDPYVTIDVHDIVKNKRNKDEHVCTNHTTSAVNNNGFCPIWENEEKEFLVHSPEVAMVHFCAIDDDVVGDDRVADAAIPISCLRKGVRSIQLYDKYGTRSGPFSYATLLVEIDY